LGQKKRIVWCLIGCAISVAVMVGMSVFLPDRMIKTGELIANNGPASRLRAATVIEPIIEATLIEMQVEMVGVSPIDNSPLVLLREKAGERYLPIAIGLLEARNISVTLSNSPVPRPLSSDLTSSIITRLGANVQSVTINDLRDSTFYASIMLTHHWTRLEIDSRPSDAIAVALRVGAPINVTQVVLDKAGIVPQPDEDEIPPLVLKPSR